MINTMLTVVHVFVALVLIVVVLLQSGKGAGLGAGFGGGSQSLFGARGPSSFLSKFTSGAAIVFMLTSLTLSVVSGGIGKTSVIEGGAGTAAPSAPAAPAAPAGGQQSGDIDPFKAVHEAQQSGTVPPPSAPEQKGPSPQAK